MTTETTITIEPLTDPAALYRQYPGQTSPQPAHIELDPATRTLSAGINPEIGNAVPVSIFRGRILRWTLPGAPWRADAAARLMAQIAPMAERICDGYEEGWDGSDPVGFYDHDAEDAIEEIRDVVDGHIDSDVHLSIWDAESWYGCSGQMSLLAVADDLSREGVTITAETDDAGLDQAGDQIEELCASDADVDICIEGTGRRLAERIRDALAEEAS